jgi:hypothetical protein
MRFEIFHHKARYWVKCGKPSAKSQLPLPSGLGARWYPTDGAVTAVFAAGGFTVAPGAAHLTAGCNGLLDPHYCIRLNIQAGVRFA